MYNTMSKRMCLEEPFSPSFLGDLQSTVRFGGSLPKFQLNKNNVYIVLLVRRVHLSLDSMCLRIAGW